MLLSVMHGDFQGPSRLKVNMPNERVYTFLSMDIIVEHVYHFVCTVSCFGLTVILKVMISIESF